MPFAVAVSLAIGKVLKFRERASATRLFDAVMALLELMSVMMSADQCVYSIGA